MYKLAHEFPKNLRLTILGNEEILGNLKNEFLRSVVSSL